MAIPGALEELTEEEFTALRGAAVWYANYHAAPVAAEAGNPAAYAVADRERYLALIAGLRKLGVRIPLPDALAADTQAA